MEKAEASIPLEERAMLCHVEIHFYGFHKYDREVSDVAAEQMGADNKAGRYNKSLIEREGIKTLQKIAGDIRRYHRRNTLPWKDDEYRILPSTNYIEHSKGLRERIAEFDKRADSFCKTLPDLYKNAKKQLGKMYKEEEYPEPKVVRSRYWVKVKISPVPVSGDFRVSTLDKKDVAIIKKDLENEKAEAVKGAMTSLWQRLQKPIQKMAEKLSDKDEDFRDSLVNNITTIVDMIPKLNIGDPEINKFAKEVKVKLCKVDPKELRKDNKTRKDTAKVAKEILDKMEAYC